MAFTGLSTNAGVNAYQGTTTVWGQSTVGTDAGLPSTYSAPAASGANPYAALLFSSIIGAAGTMLSADFQRDAQHAINKERARAIRRNYRHERRVMAQAGTRQIEAQRAQWGASGFTVSSFNDSALDLYVQLEQQLAHLKFQHEMELQGVRLSNVAADIARDNQMLAAGTQMGKSILTIEAAKRGWFSDESMRALWGAMT